MEGRAMAQNYVLLFRSTFFILLISFIISIVKDADAGSSDPVGTKYSSQKIAFKDPVSGKTVWRLTVDGKQNKALNNISDTSGMESNKFSTDSTKICYAKTGHPSKPSGYYVMDIISGIETYVAPIGDLRWGACAFSKTTNELFHVFIFKGSNQSNSYGEIRAVNLSSHFSRVLKRFIGMRGGNIGLSLNKDGNYIATHFGVGDPELPYTDPAIKTYQVILKTSDGAEHPNWKLDISTPDMVAAAGDHGYWHPTKTNAIRAYRDGSLKIWNIDTLKVEPNPVFMGEVKNLYGSHNCQTVDGAIQFHTWGHADCHPLDAGKGENTRAALDRRQADYPYLYVTAFRNANGYGNYPVGLTDVVAIHYNYAAGTHNYAHSHPHFSRDGKYLLFASAVNNLVAGTPPGGADNDTYTVDLFIVPLSTVQNKLLPPTGLKVLGPDSGG
jgi:hypothetical protein